MGLARAGVAVSGAPAGAFEVGGRGVARVAIGGGAPFALIAGPCVLEPGDRALRIGEGVARACALHGVPLIFKASFDKANRSSAGSYRGPGLDAGLDELDRIRAALGVPVTTDVHLPAQCDAVAEVVDLLQIPAFLCRQTDLVAAAAATGRPLHLKKGQFMAPEAMGPAAAKAAGAPGVLLTERGASFGYGDLVVDLRSLPRMRALGHPVGLDATHGVQRPAAGGPVSGGDRGLVPALARAGVAVGLDALFLEVHDDPDAALSDGPNALPLAWLPGLLGQLVAIARALEPA
jgi:2-dehydro-3-deoxyphosphooctonate aldolase (KDO 8-P synthase)